MEFLFSWLLYKKDLSRVIYSKEDIAFRRRVELLGKGDIKGQQLNVINLDLPFTCYSQTSSLEEDDRPAAMNSAAAVRGHYLPNLDIVMRHLPVKIKYSATCFFGRRDDVNVASQLLYWEMNPKGPLYFMVKHTLAGYPLEIPVFMTIESVDSNVDYAEKTFLESSRIFPIKVELTIRSYQCLIENIENTILLPLRFSGYGVYNQNRQTYYANECVMEFVETKFCQHELTENSELTDEVDEQNKQVKDIVEGYFQEDPDVALDTYRINEEKSGENNLWIEWHVREADQPYFKMITISCPGVVNNYIEDLGRTFMNIEHLQPGSEYTFIIVTHSTHASTNMYRLVGTTKGKKSLSGKLSDKLVGKEF